MEFTTSGNIPLTASNKPKSGEVCGVSRDRIVTLWVREAESVVCSDLQRLYEWHHEAKSLGSQESISLDERCMAVRHQPDLAI